MTGTSEMFTRWWNAWKLLIDKEQAVAGETPKRKEQPREQANEIKNGANVEQPIHP